MAWHKEGGWFHRSRNHVVVISTGRAIHHTSRLVHRLLALGTGLLVVTSCLLAGAAWRLSQGPIDLAWLSDHVRAALIDNAAPVHVSVDGVSLAWEGFHKGVDYPLDVRLSDIAITNPAGQRLITAPGAHLTFSLAGLLLGRMVPRAIEVDHAQIAVTRDANGMVNLGWDLGGDNSSDAGSIDLRQIGEQLARPVSSDHGRTRGLLDQIQRVHFRDAEMTFRDRKSGLVVQSQEMDLDLDRARSGHVRGLLQAPLSIGSQQANLTLSADWTAGSDNKLEMRLTSLRPAGVGSLPPELAFAAGIDVPVSMAATVGFDARFKPSQMRADIQIGQGHIKLAQGSVPVRSGLIEVSAIPGKATITQGHFDVAHTSTGNPEIVDLGGTVTHEADRLSASFTLGLAQIDVADLPLLWPPGVAEGARPWVIEHVTQGMATRGTAAFVVEADDGLNDVVLTKATGDLDGSNGTFTWIDNMPPIEQTEFHLHLVDPDTLDIHVSSAHQRIRNGGGDLLIHGGQMRISGLSQPDQTAVIRAQVDGPIASALALLKEPRLHLLSTHPIALRTGGGDGAATLDCEFPLENKLQVDDVQIHVDAHLTKVRLLDVAGGQDLDGGVFDLGVDKDGLSLKGQGSIAAVPVTVDGTMDFKPGPPDQIVQKIAMTGQPDAAQLDKAGLPVADFLSGPVPLTVAMIGRRSGSGSVAVNGDLTLARLAIDPLAWSKPAGAAANISATLLMSHDRLTKIDRIAVRGDSLLLTGSADFVDGHVRTLLLDTIRLGRSQGHGTIHLAPNDPVGIVFQGEQIDLAPKLTDTTSGADRSEAMTASWTLDARFDHAILAHGERAGDILVKAAGTGQSIRLLDAVGKTQPNSVFSIKIEPLAGKTEPLAGQRHLRVEAKDAGSFLRGIDAIEVMQSGSLTIDGTFDRPSGFYPVAGTAMISDVIVRKSPVLGKLLQAITLYGLVDALRGPGMTFSRIVVPFHYDGADLSLDEAHAYNASLGLTATGRIGLSSGQTSIAGTIVPAYFFNSMLGRLPLVGKLFSPEKGGGVFAARFGVDGPNGDPSISINPVSALTPGFLRDVFNVFNQPSANSTSQPKE